MKGIKIFVSLFLVMMGMHVTVTFAEEIALTGYDPIRGGTTVSTKAQKVNIPNKLSERLINDSKTPTVGNENALVTLVEFLDYRCSHCIAVNPIVQAVLANNSDLRLVIKGLPVRGPKSIFAAKAALAANKQGKFNEFHKALIRSGMSDEARVMSIAKSLGLNIDKFKSDMDSAEIQKQVQDDKSLAYELGVSGTPTFFITRTFEGDPTYLIQGEVDQAYLQSIINKVSK